MSAVFTGTQGLLNESFPTSGINVSNQFTIALWAKHTNTVVSPLMQAGLVGTPSNNRAYLRFNAGKNSFAEEDGGTNQHFNFLTTSGANNTWQFMCARHINTASRLFRADLVAATTNSGTDPLLFDYSSLATVCVGSLKAGVTGYYHLIGAVADVAIWDTVITVTEETQLYNKTHTPLDIQPSRLIGYWPLYEDGTDYQGTADLTSFEAAPSFSTGDHPVAAPIATSSPVATIMNIRQHIGGFST